MNINFFVDKCYIQKRFILQDQIHFNYFKSRLLTTHYIKDNLTAENTYIYFAKDYFRCINILCV